MDYAPQTCPFCNGSGTETITWGPTAVRSSCRTCNGSGVYIKYPCTECLGQGMVTISKWTDIPVPSSTEDGQTMRVEIEGNELFITFRVSKWKHFLREGYDIHSNIPIWITWAVLGGHTQIEGLYNDEEDIEIPSGTSSHDVISLKGKGLKKPDTNIFGDHLVDVEIKVPQYSFLFT